MLLRVSVCLTVSSQSNVQSAEVGGLSVAASSDSLAICHHHIWTHERDTNASQTRFCFIMGDEQRVDCESC